eukprot:TRINITY_DN585_c0_g1_i1.p1 TRINITY_DN585_c0_g1~~TRINITY_DN585_c0_g1_i1.p1  ORF type:complete len:445 (-),score=56.77 TRINITY_DN585_c0_g1_i1:2078-3412(-)
MEVSIRKIIGGIIFFASYVLLYFGLFGDLVSVHQEIKFDPDWFKDEPDQEVHTIVDVVATAVGSKPLPIIPYTTRSLLKDDPKNRSLISMLSEKSGSPIPPGLLIFFGVIVPLVKMVVTIVWIVFPSDFVSSVRGFVSKFSKYISIDAVVEAMIVAFLMMGGVNAQLRQGYVCFVGYVFFSILGSWLLNDKSSYTRAGMTERIMYKMPSITKVPSYCSVITLIIFLGFLAFGSCVRPVARMWLPEKVLRANVHTLIDSNRDKLFFFSASAIDRFEEDLVKYMPTPKSESTLLHAAMTLLSSGDVLTIVGSTFLFIGVLVCPVVHACCGCYLAQKRPLELPVEVDANLPGKNEPSKNKFYDFALWIMHFAEGISMLDVYVIGMATATCVFAALDDFLHCVVLDGFFCIVFAVVFGYIHNIVCKAPLIHDAVRQMNSSLESPLLDK